MNQDVELNQEMDAGAPARRVLDELGGVILGQEEVLRQMTIALLARGHALLEGVPGVAKTLAIRALALSLRLRFGRVQFTPDLMPTDLTGVNVLDELRREFVFHAGPIFTDLLLADEINRAPAKTQSALLEAMQERQVTTDGVSRPLPAPFTVFASQNPVEYEGTYPLPEAQLDRFLLKIVVPYPSEAAELAILERYAGGFRAEHVDTYGLRPLLDASELETLRAATAAVHVEPVVREYITRLVRATRVQPGIALGASPRATVALFAASQAEALLNGRDFVTPDDVKSLAPAVLRHRIQLTPEMEVEGRSTDHALATLLEVVPSPR
ncbi:MAG TPA: MoxR family ATPase [Longimicrobiaceae bacterium]|nr:MoxR family ATPase [Longimicrobiaceae bacterium]